MKNLNRIKDLTGKRFGRLTVLGLDVNQDTRKTFWECQCDCGKIITTRSDRLQSGRVKSCGCYKKEQDARNVSKNHKHKMSGTRIYHEWQGMKARCYNENDSRYSDWGGRGIKVCDQWKNDFSSFYDWSIKNGYQENKTIDRINNDGNYEPSNCRWATMKEQSNNRRSNINITIGNTTKTLTQWCEVFDIDYKKVNRRYKRNPNMPIDRLFSDRLYRGNQ